MLGGGYWTKHDAKRILNAVLNVECVESLEKARGICWGCPFLNSSQRSFRCHYIVKREDAGDEFDF